MTSRPQPPPAETLLTTREVAALLRVHPKQVYRLMKQGLPALRVGGEWRFERSVVLGWTHGSAEPPPATSAPTASAPTASTPAASPARDVPPLLAANGDVVIELLLERVNALVPAVPALGFLQSDRERSLALLERGAVLAAGCHGEAPPPTRLGADRLARVHLVTREVGLVAPAGTRVPSLANLARLRVATRPASAGISAHLARALERARVDPARALARGHAYGSHRDVACAVLRGEADAGLATRAWAQRTGLAFRALATESYGLLVRGPDLGHPVVVRVCEAAQSRAFHRALGAVPGYDPAGAGDIRYDPERS